MGAFVALVATGNQKKEKKIKGGAGLGSWLGWWCSRPIRKTKRKIIKGSFDGNWDLSGP